jgi:WD40 repeat protein
MVDPGSIYLPRHVVPSRAIDWFAEHSAHRAGAPIDGDPHGAIVETNVSPNKLRNIKSPALSEEPADAVSWRSSLHKNRTAVIYRIARVADRSLRMLLFAIALAAAGLGSSAHAQNAIVSPPSGAAQSNLPGLRLARTLSAPNEISTSGTLQSGNSGLTWSPDGERLAAYVHNGLGIIVWSPDGKYQHEIPRYNNSGLDCYVLAFLSGHRQIVASPAAETGSRDDRDKMDDVAFSILDAETGKVLRNVAGPNPGKRSNENIAIDMAISADERFAAVIYRQFTDKRIGIYSTSDWQRVAAIDLRDGEKGELLSPQGLAFSPDGKTLAVLHGFRGRVKFFEVGSWRLLHSVETFPEVPPPMNVLLLDALSFSPDGTLIAVASHGGGSWWKYPNGNIAQQGSGVLTPIFPAEPLRVYRVSDGARIASVGSFPGGLERSELVWSPKGDYLSFLDASGNIRFWDPLHPGDSVTAASMGHHSRTLLFSKDGSQLVASFENGVKVFDVINHQ